MNCIDYPNNHNPNPVFGIGFESFDLDCFENSDYQIDFDNFPVFESFENYYNFFFSIVELVVCKPFDFVKAYFGFGWKRLWTQILI